VKEIKQNFNDEKWKEAYDIELQKQFLKFKGEVAMGKGFRYTKDDVRRAALDQMKKDAVFQNAINWLDQKD
jgi:hypothetical protein